MASISHDSNGTRRLLFVDPEGKRRPIRLGKITAREAEAIKTRVELLLVSKISGNPIDSETALWLAKLGKPLADKLAKVDLIPRRETINTTLGAFIDDYLTSRTDIKPRTRINLLQVRKNLVDHFGENKQLQDVTPGDADEWRRWMLSRTNKLGDNTVRRHCGRAKQLFRAALRKRLISENPFADMKSCSVQANKSREYFVSREEAAKVLTVCPDHEWRLIFALARFGGLRTPSETLILRWGDVDWERGRILVRSPKTEHHEGKDSRWVPIFPELRPHLEKAWDQAEAGTEFVINRYRDGDQNLRTTLLRIICCAGLTAWPKLFQNLRSTRETELAEIFPLHVVTAWLGNSQAVATKHYLQVTDEHFERGATVPTPGKCAHNRAQQPSAGPRLASHSETDIPQNPRKNRVSRANAVFGVPPQGLEP